MLVADLDVQGFVEKLLSSEAPAVSTAWMSPANSISLHLGFGQSNQLRDGIEFGPHCCLLGLCCVHRSHECSGVSASFDGCQVAL